jgi:hypothetical protein
MKFDERNKKIKNPPFFISMATAAKFVLPIPIFLAYLVPLDVDVTGNSTGILFVFLLFVMVLFVLLLFVMVLFVLLLFVRVLFVLLLFVMVLFVLLLFVMVLFVPMTKRRKTNSMP